MAGKTREDFELSYSCFVVTGRDEAEFAASKKATQERIAFYGSTPAYKGVLESIGVGELQGELNTIFKQGRWQEMGTLITDDILAEFGVMGEPAEIAPQMLERYGPSRTALPRRSRFLMTSNAEKSFRRFGPVSRVEVWRC